MIEEPNEALNGECEPPAGAGPTPGAGPEACACCEPPPPSEPNGKDGEIENVEPPKLNEGPDWPDEKRLCDGIDWLAPNCSNGDWAGWLCCCG